MRFLLDPFIGDKLIVISLYALYPELSLVFNGNHERMQLRGGIFAVFSIAWLVVLRLYPSYSGTIINFIGTFNINRGLFSFYPFSCSNYLASQPPGWIGCLLPGCLPLTRIGLPPISK
jgi:hypothetical protein